MMPTDPPGAVRRGTLLFAHGARDPNWRRPFEAVRDQVAALRPGDAVSLAFLEFMAPSLPEAGDMLAREGCAEVTIVPLFLGAGGHVRKDLPGLVEALAARHPTVQWRLAPAVGEAPEVIEAMARAAVAAGVVAGPGAGHGLPDADRRP